MEASDTVPSFDQLRADVRPGAGIIARFPGVLAITAVDGADPAIVERFLTICAEVSAAGARAPGRRLARQLAGWLSQLEDAPTLGTVAPTDGGLAVFLSGAVAVHRDGSGDVLTGRDSAGWLDRIIEWPTALALSLDPDGAVEFSASVYDLRQGTVPGTLAVLTLPVTGPPVASAVPEAPPAPAMEAVPAEPAPPAVEPPPPPAIEPQPAVEPPPPPPPVAETPRAPLPPPVRSSRIFGSEAQEPPREPLPVAAAVGEPVVTPESDATPKVQGFLCSRGHLNDPRGLFCGICGIRMAERTGILTIGRRPPLGLLVFDDGVTFTVDADYLLGREPDADPRVQQGVVRPLVVVDSRGAVSRRHAEIHLDGWTVLLADIGSANGTFIAPRGQQAWSALVPQRPVALDAGTRVRLGNRMFVFESPHGAP